MQQIQNKEIPEEFENDKVVTVVKERWVPELSDLEWLASLDNREIEEIRLAYFYAQDPHGTNGHNRLILIAKLADRISTLEDLINAAYLSDWNEHSRTAIHDALLTGEG